jgi:cyclic beta-1,2-glucan synthetase
LARGSALSELEVTERVLAEADAAAASASPELAARVGDPGHFLIGDGRQSFERAIGAKAPIARRIRRAVVRAGLPGYAGAIGATTAVLLAVLVASLAATGVGAAWRLWLAIALAIPLSEIATALVHRLITRRLGTRPLPALDLSDGVPSAWRTLVAVPTILTDEADVAEMIERLEVHYLTALDGDLTFALLSDGADADAEVVDGDAALQRAAADAVAALNVRHPPGPAGPRFVLLHRRRVFDAGAGVWMGWERKRGKLRELNRLLRGARDTTFVPVGGQPVWVPEGVRFVVTLDADTRLPRGAAQKLVGKMAHPLNRPILDPRSQRVVHGYGILQPRVTSSLPTLGAGSLYERVFGGPSGIDPYASAVSDVYQDLFGEGSFTGKGIYDVDAFEAALAGRIPDGTMLSHDLFEGVFARAGLASDVEVIEATPARYDVAVKRQHRWTRGDWQLLPWLTAPRARLAVPPLGRWKMLDNLRRSWLAPSAFVALVSSWLLPPGGSASASRSCSARSSCRRSCRRSTRWCRAQRGRAPQPPRHPARGPRALGRAGAAGDRVPARPRPGRWATRWCGRSSGCTPRAATCSSGRPPRTRRGRRTAASARLLPHDGGRHDPRGRCGRGGRSPLTPAPLAGGRPVRGALGRRARDRGGISRTPTAPGRAT